MESSTPSRIRYRQDGRRQGHLLNIMGFTKVDPETQEAAINDQFLYFQVASFLGWKHVQERSGVVVPSLAERLKGCDLDITIENRDTQMNVMQATRELVAATTEDKRNEDWQFPFAMAGATFSRVSLQLSWLAAGYELPQVSGGSGSTELDSSPFFARTIPGNDAAARSIMLYYQSIGVTHMAALYQWDDWGIKFNAAVQAEAFALGISVTSFSYDPSSINGIKAGVDGLKASGMKYVFAMMVEEWESVVEAAFDAGVIGNPNYSWVCSSQPDWSQPMQFSSNDPREAKLVRALDGVGVFLEHVPPNPKLEAAMVDFASNKTLQQEFVDAHADPSIFTNFTFTAPALNQYQYLYYDAALSLGIAACETPGLFTGPELYKTLLNLQFEGVSGSKVTFDSINGNRGPGSVSYRIDNVFISNDALSNDATIRTESQMAAVVIDNGNVANHPGYLFQYNSNTTLPPQQLPTLEHDYNLIPAGALAVGWSMAALVICFSLGLMGWTWQNRNIYVVRASQPIFLGQLCLGTAIMLMAIFPMGIQGEQPSLGLDVACMAGPWLVCLGFGTAFSALVSKAWRLNQLLNSGQGMRRIQVNAVDVMWPFLVLMTINVALLLGWTIKAPSHYVRIEHDSTDVYGRNTSSYGTCESEDQSYLYFAVPLYLINFIGVATTAYQTYQARNLPTELSESTHLAWSMASLLETLCLGGPVYVCVVVLNDPTAVFLVGTSLLCVCSMTILIPVFYPKYIRRHLTARGRGGTNIVRSSNPKRSHQSQQTSVEIFHDEHHNPRRAWGMSTVARHPPNFGL